MPIYEYQCEECGHQMEALQKISDDLLKDCPSCNTQGLRKMISAPAFRLKGGGWYETDFKSGDNKKNLAGDGKSPSGSDSKPDKPGGGGDKGGCGGGACAAA